MSRNVKESIDWMRSIDKVDFCQHLTTQMDKTRAKRSQVVIYSMWRKTINRPISIESYRLLKLTVTNRWFGFSRSAINRIIISCLPYRIFSFRPWVHAPFYRGGINGPWAAVAENERNQSTDQDQSIKKIYICNWPLKIDMTRVERLLIVLYNMRRKTTNRSISIDNYRDRQPIESVQL